MKTVLNICSVTFLFLCSCNSLFESDKQVALDPDIVKTSDSILNSLVVPDIFPEMPVWLLGNWEFEDQNSLTEEKWEMENDSTYTAVNYLTVSKGTVVQEYIRLEMRNKNLFYIPTPQLSNQKPMPVTFTLSKFTDSSLVFENRKHDFPQVIAYTMINKDSVVAFISGPYEGKTDTVWFPMSRRKK